MSDELIHRYLDDRSALSEGELDELIAHLRAEPARAAALREQLLLDDLLAQKLAVDRQNFPAQVDQRIADFQRGQEELDAQVTELRQLAEAEIDRPRTWSGTSPWVKYVLALSAAVLIGGVFFASQWLPAQPYTVLKVSKVEGNVTFQQGGQSSAAAVNAALLSGQQVNVPAGGSIDLVYQDATTVWLGGDAAVTFDTDRATGAKRVRIDRGELIASVAPQAAGPMVFTTPHAVATVRGTKLRLAVTETETLLDVTKGLVDFQRLGDQNLQQVAASQSGIATSEAFFPVQALAWPASREGIVYLLSSLEAADDLPYTAVRIPDTNNYLLTELLPRGAAQLRPGTLQWELSGGHLYSDEAGQDVLPQLTGRDELTLEVIFQPAASVATSPARIVALADDGESANLALSQEGSDLVFSLRTEDETIKPLRFSLLAANEPLESVRPKHMAVTYRAGELVAYRSGVEVARSRLAGGTLAEWRGGPLTIGADSRGQHVWRGRVLAIVLSSRCLSVAEIARSEASFRLLSAERK